MRKWRWHVWANCNRYGLIIRHSDSGFIVFRWRRDCRRARLTSQQKLHLRGRCCRTGTWGRPPSLLQRWRTRHWVCSRHWWRRKPSQQHQEGRIRHCSWHELCERAILCELKLQKYLRSNEKHHWAVESWDLSLRRRVPTIAWKGHARQCASNRLLCLPSLADSRRLVILVAGQAYARPLKISLREQTHVQHWRLLYLCLDSDITEIVRRLRGVYQWSARLLKARDWKAYRRTHAARIVRTPRS